MKELALPAVVILAALVVLFPPADRNIPGTSATRIGDYWFGGTAGTSRSEKFTFIGNIGGYVVIRYPQWLIEMAVVAIAFIGVKRMRSTGQQSSQSRRGP